MTTSICFTRHGETDWNVAKRIQGQTDVPLNEPGRSQALAFNAAHYEFSAVYSGDLQRALDTAKMVAERRGLEVNTLPQLRERHFGIFQGLTAEEGLQLNPAAPACYLARVVNYDFESGESMQSFCRAGDSSG